MSLIRLSIFNEPYTLKELPFHAELNGHCPHCIYQSIHKLWLYYLIYAILIAVKMHTKLIYCFPAIYPCNSKAICNRALISLQSKVLSAWNSLMQKNMDIQNASLRMSGLCRSGYTHIHTIALCMYTAVTSYWTVFLPNKFHYNLLFKFEFITGQTAYYHHLATTSAQIHVYHCPLFEKWNENRFINNRFM